MSVGQRGLLILALSLGVMPIARGAVYYVSPFATNGATGSMDDPFSFSNAISATSPVSPGDTIWMRAGTYTGAFVCYLSAPSNNPIVIRNYNGERVTLDASTNSATSLELCRSGVWVWGLEFMSSATNRIDENYNYGSIGFNNSVGGGNHKCINCIFHDCVEGPYITYQSTNTEITGCVIYNVGWQGTNGGHGHFLYVQNRDYSTPPKPVRENIGVNSFSTGINTRSGGIEVNILIQGNVIVNPGSLATNGGYRYAIYAGGVPYMDRLSFVQNYTYYSSKALANNYFFYYAGVDGGTLSLVSNVFGRGYLGVIAWTNVTYKANTAWDFIDYRTNINLVADHNAVYGMNAGTHYFAATNTIRYTLAGWQSLSGNDLNSTTTIGDPTNNWVYVRPNPYESNRGHIIVYNWNTNDNVLVDVSQVLAIGTPYQVRNAADYYGPMVTSGTYGGGTITLPMTNLSVAVPIGRPVAPPPTGPKFNAFVLLPSAPPQTASRPLPPSNLTVLTNLTVLQ